MKPWPNGALLLLSLLLVATVMRVLVFSTNLTGFTPSFNTLGGAEQQSKLDDFLAAVEPFTLVLQPNVPGDTASFLKLVVLPECVIVSPLIELPAITLYSLAPTTDTLRISNGNLTVTSTSRDLLESLRKRHFSKVFINHPLGFSLDFLKELFAMQKRHFSMIHDYVWVFDKIEPTFADLQSPGNARRNYALKEFLLQLDIKAPIKATSQNFLLFEHFNSMDVVPMPDYQFSKKQPINDLQTSKNLVIGVIGDLSWVKGLDTVLELSRLAVDDGNHVTQCEDQFVGSTYIQLGEWRIAPVDDLLSISHRSGQTPLIFRSDGSMDKGPRTDYNAWGRTADICTKLVVVSGSEFLQIGDWRIGSREDEFVVSHRLSTSRPSILKAGTSVFASILTAGKSAFGFATNEFASTIWNLPEESSSIKFQAGSLQIGSWSLVHSGESFWILHPDHGVVMTLSANGVASHGFFSGIHKVTVGKGSCRFRSNVKVVVFGNVASFCDAGNNFYNKPFRSIDEFNELLLHFGPNVLLVPTLWPETYSYTLTLAMLTNLPIIVRKGEMDFEAAISSRAAAYPRSHFDNFTSMKDVLALANSIKADTLTQVNNDLVVPQQWRNLLRPTLPNVVLVASKIVTSDKPLWYYPKRSRFSVRERFEQTLDTISSIRSIIPDSFIVLIDNSRFNESFMYKQLKSRSDIFINDEYNKELRHWTDNCSAKQLGEAMLLLQGLEALETYQVMYEQLFKLTGRYLINAHFDFEMYANTHNVFKRAQLGRSIEQQKTYYAYTCFFKIHYSHIEAFRTVLSNVIAELQTLISRRMPVFLHDDIESRLSSLLPDVKYVPSLGVTQKVSTWDTEDKDI